MKLPKKTTGKLFLLLLAILPFLILIPNLEPLFAGATLFNMSDTVSDMNVSDTGVTHSYSFQVTSTSKPTSISITASTAWGAAPPTSGWSVKDAGTSETVGSVTTSTTLITIPTTWGATAPVNGDTITITNATGWKNQTSTGSYTETINTGFETGVLAVDIISNDQVTLTAVVGPSLSFSLSTNSLNIPNAGNLAVGSESQSNTDTLTVTTNATNNTLVTIQDLNGNSTSSLFSSVASHTFPQAPVGSAAVLAAEGFGAGSTAASSGTIPAQFLDNGTGKVGRVTTSAVTFWTITGAVNAVTATPFFGAYASGTTPAGTYTDTVTFICTSSY